MECPKCRSKSINQYRMPTGAIWCNDCGFREEQKERNNPFLMPHTSSDNEYTKCINEIEKLMMYRGSLPEEGKLEEILRKHFS